MTRRQLIKERVIIFDKMNNIIDSMEFQLSGLLSKKEMKLHEKIRRLGNQAKAINMWLDNL